MRGDSFNQIGKIGFLDVIVSQIPLLRCVLLSIFEISRITQSKTSWQPIKMETEYWHAYIPTLDYWLFNRRKTSNDEPLRLTDIKLDTSYFHCSNTR